MRLWMWTLMASVLLTGVATGCGPEGEESAEQDPAPNTVVERTVVERTVIRTVVEKPEEDPDKSQDEPEAVEVSDEKPSPVEDNNFLNDTGAIGADVPDEWSDRTTDEVWELNGEAVGPAFTVTTDLYAWEESGQATAGTYVTASSSLKDSSTLDEILDSPGVDISGSCTLLAREDFESHGYTGRLQGGVNCAPSGKSLVNVAASRSGEECLVFVQVGYTTEEEKAWAERVLDSFEADCEKVSEFEKGLDDYVVEEEPEQVIGCAGFASQYAAQQYYDFNATPEERTVLDPDANGFACDFELLGYQLTYEEPETQSSDPTAPNYVEPPLERDGVCEGVGEIDPDCADAMREALEGGSDPETFD